MNDRVHDSPPTSGYGEVRTREVAAHPEVLWEVVAGIGGETGWYAFDRLWRARAALDRLVGGPGMRGRGRELHAGGTVDFWRVVDVVPSERLLLRAEMKMPGTPWLELAVEPVGEVPARSRLIQRVWFAPDNLLGHAMWWTELAGHKLVFSRMLDGIVDEAEDRST